MGVPLNDEIVVIQKGKYEGDTSLVTINCPDKLGLGCDLTRIFMDFNLDVVGAGEYIYLFYLSMLLISLAPWHQNKCLRL
jgi:hypothetical protein